MNWIENEVVFANSLIFDHSCKCSEFIQDIYNELDTQLSLLLPGQFNLTRQVEESVRMPPPILPSITLAPQKSKRPINFTPSPTRKSPDRKKPMLNRPITAPRLRSPLREVSDNLKSPRKQKQNFDEVDLSITSIRGSGSGSESPRKVASPIRSPVRSPVRYPKLDIKASPSKMATKEESLARLIIPTVSSMQHANSQTPLSRKAPNNDQSSLQLRLNLRPQRPAFKAPTKASESGAVPSAIGTPLLGSSAGPRPLHSKIPVSVNTLTSGDTTQPIAYSSSTPFKFGLKKPLPRPPAPSPCQMTLPDISDNDSGASLLRSWAATPEVARQMEFQTGVDPLTVFGAMGPLEIEKIFVKPDLLRGRKRTSSAAWEYDGLTLKERNEYASDMGFGN